MDETLLTITARVNRSLGTSFTILMNVYRSGEDCFAFHRDSTEGWVPGSGFATLSSAPDATSSSAATRRATAPASHTSQASPSHMPHPMNDHFTHGIPKRKRVDECRIVSGRFGAPGACPAASGLRVLPGVPWEGTRRATQRHDGTRIDLRPPIFSHSIRTYTAYLGTVFKRG
jgi:hypothetical protein